MYESFLLHSILESSSNIIVYAIDLEYRYTMFTQTYAAATKTLWNVDIALGMNILDVIQHEGDRQKAKINFDRVLLGEYIIVKEKYGDHNLLRTFWENRYAPVKNERGVVIGLSVFVIDITEQIHSEVLKEREMLLNCVGDGVYGMDIYGRCFFVNPSALKMLEHNENEMLGKSLHELIHYRKQNGEPFPIEECEIHKVQNNCERVEYIDWFIKKCGIAFPVRVIATPVIKEDAFIGVVVAFNDITLQHVAEQRLKEANEALKTQANTDSLTGLYNRRYFDAHGNDLFLQSKHYGEHFSILTMDIDFFKKINDLHGHDVGDVILARFAHSALCALRKSDVFARVGGEEFTVLLPKSDLNSAIKIANRIQENILHQKIEISNQIISYTISIGIASLTDRVASFDVLLKLADTKLYTAKQNGRNRIEY